MNLKLITITTIACGLAFTGPMALAANEKAKTDAPAGAAKVAAMDLEFAKKAALGNMVEVELGELASDKGSTPEVKEFGALMVTDHSKANEDLKAVATAKGIELPAELDAKHKATVDKMAKMSGADFDKAYVKDMLADHKMDVAEFEKATKSLKDPELKGFAEATLPVLKTHLEHVKKLSEAGGHPAKKGA